MSVCILKKPAKPEFGGKNLRAIRFNAAPKGPPSPDVSGDERRPRLSEFKRSDGFWITTAAQRPNQEKEAELSVFRLLTWASLCRLLHSNGHVASTCPPSIIRRRLTTISAVKGMLELLWGGGHSHTDVWEHLLHLFSPPFSKIFRLMLKFMDENAYLPQHAGLLFSIKLWKRIRLKTKTIKCCEQTGDFFVLA